MPRLSYILFKQLDIRLVAMIPQNGPKRKLQTLESQSVLLSCLVLSSCVLDVDIVGNDAQGCSSPN